MKISIVVPVYNAEKYLTNCLDSLVNQTYKDYEIVVINDGSTDQSKLILDQYANKHNCMVVYHQENQGQAKARNKGVELAQGEFICFVDSDDTITLDALEQLVNKQEENNDDIVWCNAKTLRDQTDGLLDEHLIYHADSNKLYFLNNMGPWRKIIRKSLITNNHLEFPTFARYEDIAVMPALACVAHGISYIETPLFLYNMHDDSLMHQSKYSPKLDAIFGAMEYLHEVVERFGALDSYHQELEWLYIEHLLHAASLRYFPFAEGRSGLAKIVDIMQKQYPGWMKNPYYQTRNWKFKLICRLFYKKRYGLLRILLK
ncbi:MULTISPECIES: glycosyltransferase family 2 protein [unclassified Breznakia]|uniref:glycosyltransferase family 2 protein n=1 Tax=unclassified Breznakia TaxID=2623764 RepID=UPI002473CA21|nr:MULTISPECIES: glycosyltransferase family 2 protein [unclassified Breznakia]MDH6367908.1 glycosyltransferase involved in cell wall biosynthesis [Breznakia sp. PH1-1]MDH6404996.1 glycosyltransferase involved in cell wall biosynthesis [Breznakia sp. PF1-11]MDH6412693.1 glycosyltransferase involved in cell wall biosynthesis [Breznakia sp. PFB1-11]MDH6415071.1 glycosyltransferase involved in cell wall biosynthesis [Breznakia sp. PFB1-14]MDH6417382.1 glycosyltransferase involved in cell wall bios